MDGRKKTKARVYGKKGGDGLIAEFAALRLSLSPQSRLYQSKKNSLDDLDDILMIVETGLHKLDSEKTSTKSKTRLSKILCEIDSNRGVSDVSRSVSQPHLSLRSVTDATTKLRHRTQRSPKQNDKFHDPSTIPGSSEDPECLQKLRLVSPKDPSRSSKSLNSSSSATSPSPLTEPSSALPQSKKLGSPKSLKPYPSTHPSLNVRFKSHPATVNKATANYVEALTALHPGIESFQGWLDDRTKVLTINKVGEGSYGEVYRARDSSNQTVIFKLIPLRLMKGPGSRSRTSIKDAVNEVKLLEKMSQVPGFVEFRGACVLKGTMPTQLVEQWNAYKATDRSVETDDPNKKRTYPSNQLWLALEMSDAGIDLSYYQPLDNVAHIPPNKSWDIFWQTVKALAKAEIHAEFEHRDLHIGNICIDDRGSNTSEGNMKLVRRNEPTPFHFDSTGVRVTIIDYSLARASISGDPVLFHDLEEDDGLFDSSNKNKTYNHMLDVVGSGKWNEFRSETNVMWLSYLLENLLQRTLVLKPLRDYRTCSDEQITAGEKILLIMHEMEKMISMKKWRTWNIKSARDLLDAGLSKGWFLVEDIVG